MKKHSCRIFVSVPVEFDEFNSDVGNHIIKTINSFEEAGLTIENVVFSDNDVEDENEDVSKNGEDAELFNLLAQKYKRRNLKEVKKEKEPESLNLGSKEGVDKFLNMSRDQQDAIIESLDPQARELFLIHLAEIHGNSNG